MSFEDWYRSLTTDSEYDPSLCVAAVSDEGKVAGFVQCWTSSFIKDLAVMSSFRRHGVGKALMNHAFSLFATRKQPHVDLKVENDAMPALQLYERLGMVEVPD